MNTNGSLPIPPVRNSLESDPAYDYADDAPVSDGETEEEELLDEAERMVPLDVDDFRGEDQPIVPPPLDGDEFLEPEENE